MVFFFVSLALASTASPRVALESDVPVATFSDGWVQGHRALPTEDFQLTVAVSEPHCGSSELNLLPSMFI